MEDTNMKKSISFFFSNKLYKKKLTYTRIEKILINYGFTLFEYDLSVDDEITEIIQSNNLISCAEIKSCFMFIEDEQHKYVFIKSGCTEKDKIYMLLHEAGHIYQEHFATKELVHNTSTAKERQANRFSSMIVILNYVCRFFIPPLLASVLIASIFIIIPNTQTPQNNPEVVYYTQSGTVYHLYEDCYHLRNAVIISGAVESCGKDRVCSACELRAEH